MAKKQKFILWLGSVIITFLIVYISNLFSPDYPISGTIGINGEKVSYRFEKQHYGKDSVEIIIRSDIQNLDGKLYWRSENDSSWNKKQFKENALILSASFPAYKIGKTAKYYVELSYKDKKYLLPGNQKVTIEFYGKMPSMVNTLQFLFLYLGLLLSIRCGLEYFNQQEKIKKFEIFIVIIFLTLAMLVNPLYLSYKYGYINTSIPSIDQLFPVKTLAFAALWIISTILTFNTKKHKLIALMSALFTIIIYAVI